MKIDARLLGFHWQGRTRQGVHKWTGSPEPLKWIGRIFSVYGPIAGAGGLAALVYALMTRHWSGSGTLVLVGLIHCLLFTGIGQWALAMRRHILRLAPAEDVSAKLGIDEVTLREIAAQRNIQPRIILNDRPYYDPTEFVDALSLLRASSIQHANPVDLLRPSADVLESRSEELLRVAPVTQPTSSEVAQNNVQNQRL